MNREIARNIIPYLETLYDLNRNIIKLCGTDIRFNRNEYIKTSFDVIQDIPRLIPYTYINEKKKNVISDKDGLIEYSKKIRNLKTSYINILKHNYDCLDNIRLLRNQYEHKMHAINFQGASSGSFSFFEIRFKIKRTIKLKNEEGQLEERKIEEEKTIEAKELIKLAKELNELFAVLQKNIENYLFRYDKKNLVYDRLSRFYFKKFNSIYDSDILREIGQIMIDF